MSGAPSASTGSMHGPIALAPTAFTSDGVKPAVGEELSTEPDEVTPPVLLGAMLSPTRARHDEFVRAGGARQHAAVGSRRERPSIRRSRCRCREWRSFRIVVAIEAEVGLNARQSGDEERREADKIGKIANFERRMRVAARKAEVDRGDAVMDKLHIRRVGEHADLSAALQRQARLRAACSKSETSAGCGIVPFNVPRPWKL